MKNTKNEIQKDCSKIEDLIIEMKVGSIADREKIEIERHLNQCRKCSEFKKTLAAIENGLTIDDNLKLNPHSQIRRNLLSYLNNSKKKTPVFNRFWTTTRGFLEIRIPVYQILSAAIVLIVVFIGMEKLSTFDKLELGKEPILKLPKATFYQFNIVDDFRLINEQKIGRNFSEDSLLIKMFVRPL